MAFAKTGEDMSAIKRFEDIEGWQKGRELAKAVYAMTNVGDFARDFGLKDQMRRAAVSVMSNIAEGYGRGGNKEFLQYLSQAKGSAAEVQAQLYVALDVGYLSKNDFGRLYSLADSTASVIAGLMRYLVQSDLKGPKYHHAAPTETQNPERRTQNAER
jgi:four helix bundle protein